MKLHHIIYIALTLLTLTACSHIDEDERLVYVAPADVRRAVLIEDFTGQRCVNCPNATIEIEKLLAEYGEGNIIPVGIHSGPFAHRSTISSPLLSLGTTIGDEYYKHWGVESQPGAMINRTGGIIYDPSKYASEVKKQLERPTPVTLHISSEKTADGTFSITVDALSAEEVSGKLQVWLTEGFITDMQYMPNNDINRNYIHQHVFRTSLTRDLYGDAIHVSPTGPATTSYTANIEEGWESHNIHVVAFVYTDAEGVMQAATTYLDPWAGLDD